MRRGKREGRAERRSRREVERELTWGRKEGSVRRVRTWWATRV